MANSDDFAFPSIDLVGGSSKIQGRKGLTKREFFALQILEAIVSNTTVTPALTGFNGAAKKAIKYADALLEELEA